MEDWPKYLKILAIIGFALIVIIIALIIYFLFFRAGFSPTQPADTTTTTPIIGGLPGAKEGDGQIIGSGADGQLPGQGAAVPGAKVSPIARGGITKTTELNNTPSLGATMDFGGSDIQYFDPNTNKFYRLDKDGNSELLSEKTFHNVSQVTWSPKKDKAVLEYPDGSNIVYNFTTASQVTLPKHWEDFNYSPNSDQLVLKSIGLDPSNRYLVIANDDGTRVKAIEQIGLNADTVYPSWSSNNQIVGMYTKGIGFDRQEVFFMGLNNENFKSTVIEGRGFQSQWSPKSDKLLYSVYSEKNDLKPNLWIVNAEGNNIGTSRKSLGVETWADKCAYSSASTIYCAVPENLPIGAGLFPEAAKGSRDKLYEINTDTGLKKLIADPDGDYRMSELMISDNGFYLYFVDENTGRINKIKLK